MVNLALDDSFEGSCLGTNRTRGGKVACQHILTAHRSNLRGTVNDLGHHSQIQRLSASSFIISSGCLCLCG